MMFNQSHFDTCMVGYQRTLYHHQNFFWGQPGWKTRARLVSFLWRRPCVHQGSIWVSL